MLLVFYNSKIMIVVTIYSIFSSQSAGGLKTDFTCDDMILNDDRLAVKVYDAMPRDDLK